MLGRTSGARAADLLRKHASDTLNVSVELNSLGFLHHCICALASKAMSRVLRLTMSIDLPPENSIS